MYHKFDSLTAGWNRLVHLSDSEHHGVDYVPKMSEYIKTNHYMHAIKEIPGDHGTVLEHRLLTTKPRSF